MKFLLEYDMEIKPTKLVKGEGLEKLMEESNCDVVGLNFISYFMGNEGTKIKEQVKTKFLSSSWYKDIIFVLQSLQSPHEMDKTKAIFMKLKAIKYCILDGHIYWKDLGGFL